MRQQSEENIFQIQSATVDHSKDYSSTEENDFHTELNLTRDTLSTSFIKNFSKNDLNSTMESTKIIVSPINDDAETTSSDTKTIENPQTDVDLRIFDLLDKTSKRFVLQPATIGLNLKCQIFRQKGMYPEYKFYIENLDGNLLLLMSARKKKKSKTTSYIINYITFDLDDLEKYIETPFAKLRSNLFGTQFTLYDFGAKPVNDIEPDSFTQRPRLSNNEFDFSETTSEDVKNSDTNSIRREYAAVNYALNVLGLKGPRNMNVILPGMDENYCRDDFVLRYKSDSLLHSWKKIDENLRNNNNNNNTSNNSSSSSSTNKSSNSKFSTIKKSLFKLNLKKDVNNKKEEVVKESESEENSNRFSNSRSDANSNVASSMMSSNAKKAEFRNVVKLVNKSPQWNKEMNSFALNFNGRVTLSSVKNYQVIHEINPDYVVTQFGKVNKNLYTCDYSYPLCALQAFGIALTSLDNKIGCD